MKIPSMKFTNLKCSRKSFVRLFENYIFCFALSQTFVAKCFLFIYKVLKKKQSIKSAQQQNMSKEKQNKSENRETQNTYK